MNNSFLALPVGRVGWGYSKKLFINSITSMQFAPIKFENLYRGYFTYFYWNNKTAL